ncbi:uncharacterized protein LOC106171775 [Lingula anatina]|uniref:Uncharacterized protein LOC106171775 n=1 Tax=Lingula anatina TaxID=7574 RepID=A0A1S3JBB9_LINAN|nr:uncharacterized protein LOC106171775 [Lingula anatina]|eukprot:XP_013407697.1 uncharacterized protein LOC106171775 [Lingula anatina]
MSDVGHLYHDASHGAILDVKEFLRTRKTNAREEKHLKAQTKVIDRAIDVTRRKHRHEKASVKNDLSDILARTPSLAAIRPFSSSAVALLRENEQYHNRQRRKGSLPVSAKELGLAAGAAGSVISATKSLPAIPTAYSNSERRPRTVAHAPSRTCPDLSFEFSNFSIKTSTLYKIKRVNNISKSLSVLYAKMSNDEDRYRKMHKAHADLLERFKKAEDNEAYQIAKIVLKNSKYRSLVDKNYDPQISDDEKTADDLEKASVDLNTTNMSLKEEDDQLNQEGEIEKTFNSAKRLSIKSRSSAPNSRETHFSEPVTKAGSGSSGFLKQLVEDLEKEDSSLDGRDHLTENTIDSPSKVLLPGESGISKLPEIWKRDIKPEKTKEKKKVVNRVTIGGRIRKTTYTP